MDIKIASTSVERLAAYRFRYAVIVEEMGVMIPAADHVEKLVRDADDDHGHVFFATIDGKPAGTARVNFVREGAIVPHSDLLQLSHLPKPGAISASSRFLIAERHRGSLLAIRLMRAMFLFMRQSEIEYDFILVKSDLIGLYQRIGYLPYGEAIHHPEVGPVSPLRLSLLDEQHLRSIQSPLLHCLKPASQDSLTRSV